ncbi:MAG: metallophosphoesterase [Clostridia bacterium]|nr:metallophosphoesterase [Clostridia bacterium]
MKNSLDLNKDKIRVLQVSDPQDLKLVRKSMTEMLGRAYDTLKPDLVVFTGDNILGNHLLDARFGTRPVAFGKEATLESMKGALDRILEPVNSRKIPFAMIYGNHDDMNCITKEEQMEIYRSYEYCMQGNTDNPGLDCDTYAVDILFGGKKKFILYMFDSAWQDKDENRQCHTGIKPEAVSWFKSYNEQNKTNGGEPVSAIAFLHVPLKEQNFLLKECAPDEKGAVDCGGKFFILDPEKANGAFHEPVSCVETDNGLFDAFAEAGNIKAVVTGHDHRNCFEGSYKGIDIIQTGCASFRCYGSRDARGVRLFDLYPDGSYETKFLDYFDICGNSPASQVKFFWDSDENEKTKFALLGSAAAAVLSAAAAAALKHTIKKKG